MSILLDALRRSEAQRQLGQPPSIHSGPFGFAEAGRESRPLIPLALSLISVIVIAWIGWTQFEVPDGIDWPTPEAAGEGPVAVEQAVLSSTSDSQPAGEKSPAERELENQAARKRERLARRFGNYADKKDQSQPAQPPVAETELTPSAFNRRAGPVESAALQLEPENYQTEPLSYWALPQSVRDSMLEVKITVLVYAENPPDRFLLANGQRLLESEELDDGLVLEEIRRDGAIFRYRDYRFLMEQ